MTDAGIEQSAGRDACWRGAWACVAVFLSAFTVVSPLAAIAQDIPGVEICTHESGLDRRTGCLQSNIDFLQHELTKNARETQLKLSAAGRDVAALKSQIEAANRETAALRAAVTALEDKLTKMEKATPPSKPDAKPPEK